MMRKNFYREWLALIVLVFLLGACKSGQEEEEGVDTSELRIDSTKQNIVNVSGKLFSVPSPIQTAFLIKKTDAEFNQEMLNVPDRASRYATKFKKALNLGIYGADLGYVTIYDQTQSALDYLNAVRQLSEELDIKGAFDKEILERFSKNLGNKDSMLVLVSDAYKKGDAYLKNNDRSGSAGLILAGGWIEALHFATLVALEDSNEKIIKRIGQQKSSLNNLIKLLSRHRNRKEYNDLVEELNELYEQFQNIESEYVYKKPAVNSKKKTTHIKSVTRIDISQEELKAIAMKIDEIRNKIVS